VCVLEPCTDNMSNKTESNINSIIKFIIKKKINPPTGSPTSTLCQLHSDYLDKIAIRIIPTINMENNLVELNHKDFLSVMGSVCKLKYTSP